MQHVPARAWYTLVILVLGAVLSYTDRFILNVLVDNIGKDLRLSDVGISFAQGPAFALVYAVAALPAGLIADRANRRAILLAGMGLWSVGTLACGFAHSLPQLLLFRCVVGIGEASFFPTAVALLTSTFPPERRGLAFGALFMGGAVGSGASVVIGAGLLALLPPVLGWPLLPSPAAWRGVMIVMGGCGALLMTAVALIQEPAREVSGGAPRMGFRNGLALLISDGGGLLLVLALAATADAASSSWAPMFFARALGFTSGEIASLVGPAAIVAGAAGFLIGGVLADHLEIKAHRNGRVTLALASACLTAACLSFVFYTGLRAVAGFAALTFFMAVLNVAGASALLRRLPSNMQGFTTAVLAFTLILTGLAAGPTLVALVASSVLHRATAVGTALFLVGGCSMLGAIVVLAVLRLRSRLPAQSVRGATA